MFTPVASVVKTTKTAGAVRPRKGSIG